MSEIAETIRTNGKKRTAGQWLFNPFRFVAGYKALFLGLVIIVVTAFVGSVSNTHFDGVLDVHTGRPAPIWLFFTENLINWLCMVVLLFFSALLILRSSFRVIDILGTQALARWPHLLTALVMLPDANRRCGAYLVSKLTQTAPTVTVNHADMSIFTLAVILTILMTIWMVALMYRAYTVSCNAKGAKMVGTFIASLVIAEVLSKLAILPLLL